MAAVLVMEGWSCPVPPLERGDGVRDRRGEHIQRCRVDEGRLNVDPVTRTVCLGDELPRWPGRVDDIAVAGATSGPGLVDGIRELIDQLRAPAATMVGLVGRPERLTRPL